MTEKIALTENELKEKIHHCESEIKENKEIICDYRDKIALHSLCISGQERIIRELQARRKDETDI